MNLWNPVFRKYAERIIRKLLEHTADNRQVIGFQIDNETKQYDNMGTQIQGMFREYLKKKFVTTERLN